MICCVSRAKMYFEHRKIDESCSFGPVFWILTFSKFWMVLAWFHYQFRFLALISCPGVVLNHPGNQNFIENDNFVKDATGRNKKISKISNFVSSFMNSLEKIWSWAFGDPRLSTGSPILHDFDSDWFFQTKRLFIWKLRLAPLCRRITL